MRARRYSVESIKNNTRPLQYVIIFAIVLVMAGALFLVDSRLAAVEPRPQSEWPTPAVPVMVPDLFRGTPASAPETYVAYMMMTQEQKLAIQVELHGWPQVSADQTQVFIGGRAFRIEPGHFDETPEVKTARSLTIYEELFGPASDADVRHAKVIMNQDRIWYYFGGKR